MENALRLSGASGSRQKLQEILDSNSLDDVDCCDEDENTALILACFSNSTECAKLLLEHGAKVNQYRKSGSGPLFFAAQNGNLELVQLLIQHNAQINTQNVIGATPLLIAAQMGHSDVVKCLCSNGADVALALYDDATPLMVAAQNGHIDAVRILCEYKSDVNAIRVDGVSSLWMAAQNGHESVISYLLDQGALDNESYNGMTALFKAVTKGFHGAVKAFLAKKPSVGLSKCGYTPMHGAAYCGHEDIVIELLNYGADPDFLDKDGKDPAKVASEKGFESLAQLIMTQQSITF